MSERDLAAVSGLILETFRFNGRLLAAGDAMVAPVGLTSARWQVLGAIALSPTALPVAGIARTMGLARQTVQRLANEMNRAGLVRFAPNPHHRRAKLVLLTARGSAAYEAAMQRQRPWAKGLSRGLGAERLAAASVVLRTLRQRLEENGRGGAG